MNIILDAMGGDNAPAAVVEGAVNALSRFSDMTLTLTGDRERIEGELSRLGYTGDAIRVIHTTQVIEMCDSPVEAIRSKKDSSMVVGMKLAGETGDVFVTAGSTGAAVAGATLVVRRLPGIKRPALAPVLPTRDGKGVLLIDCGANVDCKPEYLRQFGIMGSVYMEKVMGVAMPRVGLINNGAEESKGNAAAKEAYQLLQRTDGINFVGNAEGRELLSGDFDVLVCDGFTGNVVMKFMEGFASTLMGMIKDSVMQSTRAKLGMLLAKPAFSSLKKQLDYTEYGGALMLGANAGIIKTHGSSNARAIESTLAQARRFIEGDVVGTIREAVRAASAEVSGDDA